MTEFNTSISIADRLILIYEEILRKSTFEDYEANAEIADDLFERLKIQELNIDDQGKLIYVKKLHDQIISMILLEKESLREEISIFSKKKQVSNQYGKTSNFDKMDSFFVDYRK